MSDSNNTTGSVTNSYKSDLPQETSGVGVKDKTGIVPVLNLNGVNSIKGKIENDDGLQPSSQIFENRTTRTFAIPGSGVQNVADSGSSSIPASTHGALEVNDKESNRYQGRSEVRNDVKSTSSESVTQGTSATLDPKQILLLDPVYSSNCENVVKKNHLVHDVVVGKLMSHPGAPIAVCFDTNSQEGKDKTNKSIMETLYNNYAHMDDEILRSRVKLTQRNADGEIVPLEIPKNLKREDSFKFIANHISDGGGYKFVMQRAAAANFAAKVVDENSGNLHVGFSVNGGSIGEINNKNVKIDIIRSFSSFAVNNIDGNRSGHSLQEHFNGSDVLKNISKGYQYSTVDRSESKESVSKIIASILQDGKDVNGNTSSVDPNRFEWSPERLERHAASFHEVLYPKLHAEISGEPQQVVVEGESKEKSKNIVVSEDDIKVTPTLRHDADDPSILYSHPRNESFFSQENQASKIHEIINKTGSDKDVFIDSFEGSNGKSQTYIAELDIELMKDKLDSRYQERQNKAKMYHDLILNSKDQEGIVINFNREGQSLDERIESRSNAQSVVRAIAELEVERQENSILNGDSYVPLKFINDENGFKITRVKEDDIRYVMENSLGAFDVSKNDENIEYKKSFDNTNRDINHFDNIHQKMMEDGFKIDKNSDGTLRVPFNNDEKWINNIAVPLQESNNILIESYTENGNAGILIYDAKNISADNLEKYNRGGPHPSISLEVADSLLNNFDGSAYKNPKDLMVDALYLAEKDGEKRSLSNVSYEDSLRLSLALLNAGADPSKINVEFDKSTPDAYKVNVLD